MQIALEGRRLMDIRRGISVSVRPSQFRCAHSKKRVTINTIKVLRLFAISWSSLLFLFLDIIPLQFFPFSLTVYF